MRKPDPQCRRIVERLEWIKMRVPGLIPNFSVPESSVEISYAVSLRWEGAHLSTKHREHRATIANGMRDA
jgi:hypothetical protein